MATTPQLSPQQNERLRALMLEVWEVKYDRNSSALARALGLQQPTISEFIRGKGGASYDTAKRFATLQRKSVDSIIGADEREREEILVERSHISLPQWRDLPGYMEALRFAIEKRPGWSPLVWEAIARERTPEGQEVVTVEDLVAVGDRMSGAESKLQKKGLLRKEERPATEAKTPYRRYVSDVRRLAGIGTPSGAPGPGAVKVK